MSVTIHPTAIVEEGATLESGVCIESYAYIGAHVHLARNVWVGRNAIVEGRTVIGEDSQIFAYAKVGVLPQDLKYKGEPSRLLVGKRNVVREAASMEIGTAGGIMETRVGDDNLFMINSHVGHDSIIGNQVVLGMCTGTAGHAVIGDYVRIASLSAIHQFVRIGDYAYLGLSARVNRDILPYCTVNQDSQMVGINVRGLRREGFENSVIADIKKIYASLHEDRSNQWSKRLSTLQARYHDFHPQARVMLDFARQASKQGYMKHTDLKGLDVNVDAAQD